MSNPLSDEERPLDPAVERVQRRLRRLILIAGLTLGIGMFAVFGAILFKLTAGDRAPAIGDAVRVATGTIPAGARLVSTAVDGNRILLTYEHEGSTTLIEVDARSLAVTGRLDLKPE
jgi:hypothetical protein